MRLLFFTNLSLLLGLLPGTPMAQSVTDQIAEATLAAPEPLRNGARVIVRDTEGRPTILRAGTNSLICEPDGPQPGFGVECYPVSYTHLTLPTICSV